MRKKTLLNKLICILMVQFFIFSNIGLAFNDFSNTKNEKIEKSALAIDALSIPRDYGTIKERCLGTNGTKVVYIQDAHCNYEAQTNIAKILEYLMKHYNVKFVAVEGADGIVDTSWFKAFPDEEIKKEVADYFMKKGEITGAEFLSITSDYPFTIYGAEDKKYYINNLNSFLESYPHKEEFVKYYNDIRSSLQNLKRYIYSKKLNEFDQKVEAHKNKEVKFADYARYLEKKFDSGKINLTQHENFTILLAALKYEKNIDFDSVNNERAILIDALSKKLSKERLSELVNKSLEFKLGKIEGNEFYSYLSELSKENKIDLTKDYKNLARYIIYSRIYAKIDNEELFNEIDEVVSSIKEGMFENSIQRQLDKYWKDVNITVGFMNIELTNKEYEYYLASKDSYSTSNFVSFINKNAENYGLNYNLDLPDENLNNAFRRLIDFYEIALKRDEILVKNMFKGMRNKKTDVAVLITGGFHTKGITKYLKEKNASFAVISPQITEDRESPYIAVLTGQKTPFEELILASEGASLGAPLLCDDYILSSLQHARLTPEARTLAGDILGARRESVEEYAALFMHAFIMAHPGTPADTLFDNMQEHFAETCPRCPKAGNAECVRNYLSSRETFSRIHTAVTTNLAGLSNVIRQNIAIAARANDGELERSAQFEIVRKTLMEHAPLLAVRLQSLSHLVGEIHLDVIEGAVRAVATSETEARILTLGFVFASEGGGERLTRAQAYQSAGNFSTYMLQRSVDLLAAIPKLEAMIHRYRRLTNPEEKKKLAREIDLLITTRYNAKVANRVVGTDLDAVDSDDIVKDLPTLQAFRQDSAYDAWIARAANLIETHQVGVVDVFAGAASRLFGEGQDVDTSLSFAAHDVYEVAVARGLKSRQDLNDLGAQFGISMSTRIMVQEWIKIEDILMEHNTANKSLTRREARKLREEAVWNTPRIVIINTESGRSIVEEFVNNNFYGHNPELVVFVTQRTYEGIDYNDGIPFIAHGTRFTPAGHGDASMQVVEPGSAFVVDNRGRVSVLEEDAETYIARRTNGRTKIYLQGRVNDMIRLGREAKDRGDVNAGLVDLELLALSLSQMGDLDSLEDGKSVVLEQVGQDDANRIKGGTPIVVRVVEKEILIEKLAQSAAIAAMVNIMGAPFNRFFITYKALALRQMGEQGLPVYFRFRDGYIYPETVTGDVTMLDGIKAGWALDEARLIHDYKNPDTLDNGLVAALSQDGNPVFRTYNRALADSRPSARIELAGLERVPAFREHLGTGAIRTNGVLGYSATEHGTRTSSVTRSDMHPVVVSDFSFARAQDIRKENSINGAIADTILSGDAQALFTGTNFEQDFEQDDISLGPGSFYADFHSKIKRITEALRDIRRDMPADDNGFNVIVMRGLKKRLREREVATDMVFHYGLSRRAIYIDETDFYSILTSSDYLRLFVEEGIKHEIGHISNPSYSESVTEGMWPSRNLRAYMQMINLTQNPAMQITIEEYIAENGEIRTATAKALRSFVLPPERGEPTLGRLFEVLLWNPGLFETYFPMSNEDAGNPKNVRIDFFSSFMRFAERTNGLPGTVDFLKIVNNEMIGNAVPTFVLRELSGYVETQYDNRNRFNTGWSNFDYSRYPVLANLFSSIRSQGLEAISQLRDAFPGSLSYDAVVSSLMQIRPDLVSLGHEHGLDTMNLKHLALTRLGISISEAPAAVQRRFAEFARYSTLEEALFEQGLTAMTADGLPLTPEQKAEVHAAIRDDFQHQRATPITTTSNGTTIYEVPSLSNLPYLVAHAGRGGEAFSHSLRQIYMSTEYVQRYQRMSPAVRAQFLLHEERGHLDHSGVDEATILQDYPLDTVLAELNEMIYLPRGPVEQPWWKAAMLEELRKDPTPWGDRPVVPIEEREGVIRVTITPAMLEEYSQANPDGRSIWETFLEMEKVGPKAIAGIRAIMNMDNVHDTRQVKNSFERTLTLTSLALMTKILYNKGANFPYLANYGREVRENSDEFQAVAVRTLAAMGFVVNVFPDNEATAIWNTSTMGKFFNFVLSFCGTASHAESNIDGLKIMDYQGSQFLISQIRAMIGIQRDIMERVKGGETVTFTLSAKDDPRITDALYRSTDNGMHVYEQYQRQTAADDATLGLVRAVNPEMLHIDCCHGSGYKTLMAFFNRMGLNELAGQIGWMHTEERSDFGNVGKTMLNPKTGERELFDWGADVTQVDYVVHNEEKVKYFPVLLTADYPQRYAQMPLGSTVLHTDMDNDRLAVSQVVENTPRKRELLDSLGVVYNVINSEKLVAMFIPNKFFHFLQVMNFERITGLMEQGEVDKDRTLVVLKTLASTPAVDEWVAKRAEEGHNIKVVNTAVGFAKLANVMYRAEGHMVDHPGEDVIITDASGNDINIGPNPLILAAWEESGGIITGITYGFQDLLGNEFLAEREKSATESIFLSLALIGKLQQQDAGGQADLAEYLHSIYTADDIQAPIDIRVDNKLFTPGTTAEAKQMAVEGDKRKNRIFGAHLAIVNAYMREEVTLDEAKAVLGDIFHQEYEARKTQGVLNAVLVEQFNNVDVDSIVDIRFTGDGVMYDFEKNGEKWYILFRPSGTEPKLKSYGFGKNADTLTADTWVFGFTENTAGILPTSFIGNAHLMKYWGIDGVQAINKAERMQEAWELFGLVIDYTDSEDLLRFGERLSPDAPQDLGAIRQGLEQRRLVRTFTPPDNHLEMVQQWVREEGLDEFEVDLSDLPATPQNEVVGLLEMIRPEIYEALGVTKADVIARESEGMIPTDAASQGRLQAHLSDAQLLPALPERIIEQNQGSTLQVHGVMEGSVVETYKLASRDHVVPNVKADMLAQGNSQLVSVDQGTVDLIDEHGEIIYTLNPGDFLVVNARYTQIVAPQGDAVMHVSYIPRGAERFISNTLELQRHFGDRLKGAKIDFIHPKESFKGSKSDPGSQSYVENFLRQYMGVDARIITFSASLGFSNVHPTALREGALRVVCGTQENFEQVGPALSDTNSFEYRLLSGAVQMPALPNFKVTKGENEAFENAAFFNIEILARGASLAVATIDVEGRLDANDVPVVQNMVMEMTGISLERIGENLDYLYAFLPFNRVSGMLSTQMGSLQAVVRFIQQTLMHVPAAPATPDLRNKMEARRQLDWAL